MTTPARQNATQPMNIFASRPAHGKAVNALSTLDWLLLFAWLVILFAIALGYATICYVAQLLRTREKSARYTKLSLVREDEDDPEHVYPVSDPFADLSRILT